MRVSNASAQIGFWFAVLTTMRIIGFDLSAAIRPQPASPTFPELTEREREILKLIAEGHRNAEIAATLVLSPKTVRNHITNILSKLQVADRAEAVLRAREAGLA